MDKTRIKIINNASCSSFFFEFGIQNVDILLSGVEVPMGHSSHVNSVVYSQMTIAN